MTLRIPPILADSRNRAIGELMTPATLSVLITAALLATASGQAAKSYLLKAHEPKPGQALVIKSLADSTGGQMTITRGSAKESGSMAVKRARSYDRRLVGTGPQAQLEYRVLSDQVTTTAELGGEKDTNTASGALVGQTVLGIRDDMRRWRLFLKGATADSRQAVEIAELEAYENRRWFLTNPVKVGQTWPIEAVFLRHLTERDLGRATVEASMTFKAVEMIDNEETAVLTFKVETQGTKAVAAADAAAGAQVSVTGTIHLALDTMLDKKLTMKGTLATMAKEGTQSTLVTLPVDTTVTKTLR